MSNDWSYLVWFEKCDDGESWAFTTSGIDDDEKNLNCPEIAYLINNIDIEYKDWVNTIVKIGINIDGEADFHFSDGSVSPSTAYRKECYTFLECLNLLCIGFLVSIIYHDQSVKDWYKGYVEIMTKQLEKETQ